MAPVVIFNEGLAGVAERFLKKGSNVYIEGALANRKYTDNGGAEKYVTEVVLKAFRGELTCSTAQVALPQPNPTTAPSAHAVQP